jgi:hypothetical protein
MSSNSNGTSSLDESVRTSHREPLQLTGKLDAFKSFDVTPVLGIEFPSVNLLEWLNAPDSDELFRELAITGLLPSFFADVTTAS